MNFRRWLMRKNAGKVLPLKIYTSVVESLYADQTALMVGALSTLIAASILYVRTGDPVHFLFALIVSVVGIKRISDSKTFQKLFGEIQDNRKKLRFWEQRYLVWGSAHVATLGFWCFTVSARSSDDFVLLMTISITLANLIGISGRNFGSERVVKAQLVWAAIPLVSGSFLFGDIYHALLGVFLIPFFMGISVMAGRLRNILHKSTIAAYENKIIAGRFDAAINNISHGMAMINRARRFVVLNDKFADLAGVGDQQLIDKKLSDISGGEITEYGDDSTKHNIFYEIDKCLVDGQTRRYSFVFK